MNTIMRMLALAVALVVIAAQPVAAQQSIAGIWTGALDIGGGAQLRIVVKIVLREDGSLTATMDSPDQGAKDIPIDSVEFANGYLKLGVAAVFGSYEGVVNDAFTEIDGTWTQGANSLELDLSRADRGIEIDRPQEPKPPYPYKVREVTFDNAAAGVTLAGTLTMPNGDGRFPAVIMVTGSGPQDRDESVMGHKPFLLWADYLTRRGIAVLRYDDRGIGESTGDFSTATTADFARDARAAIELLQGVVGVDPTRIGMMGHSEGAIIAASVAAEDKRVSFVVYLAGPGVKGSEILFHQGQLMGEAGGTPPRTLAAQGATQQRIFTILEDEPDDARAQQEILAAMKEELLVLSQEELDAINYSDELIAQQAAMFVQPWWRYFLAYDPAVALRTVKVPILIVNGSLDLQVDPAQNLAPIEAALKVARNDDYTIKEFAGLNHLLQTAQTGTVLEYSTITETIAPQVLEFVGDWIVAHTTGP